MSNPDAALRATGVRHIYLIIHFTMLSRAFVRKPEWSGNLRLSQDTTLHAFILAILTWIPRIVLPLWATTELLPFIKFKWRELIQANRDYIISRKRIHIISLKGHPKSTYAKFPWYLTPSLPLYVFVLFGETPLFCGHTNWPTPPLLTNHSLIFSGYIIQNRAILNWRS